MLEFSKAFFAAFVAVVFVLGIFVGVGIEKMTTTKECREQLEAMNKAAREAQTIAQKAFIVARVQYEERTKETEKRNNEKQEEAAEALDACPDWAGVAIPERLRGVLSN